MGGSISQDVLGRLSWRQRAGDRPAAAGTNPLPQGGEEFDDDPVAARDIAVLIGCLAAAALLVTGGIVYGLARLAMALLD
jgi:hypothetical protein